MLFIVFNSAEGFGSVTVHLEDENPLDCAPTESSVCQTKVCGDRWVYFVTAVCKVSSSIL